MTHLPYTSNRYILIPPPPPLLLLYRYTRICTHACRYPLIPTHLYIDFRVYSHMYILTHLYSLSLVYTHPPMHIYPPPSPCFTAAGPSVSRPLCHSTSLTYTHHTLYSISPPFPLLHSCRTQCITPPVSLYITHIHSPYSILYIPSLPLASQLQDPVYHAPCVAPDEAIAIEQAIGKYGMPSLLT